jgi:hypothetical protein
MPAGFLPASYPLAHVGVELASAEVERVGLARLMLGLGVLAPLLHLIRRWCGRRGSVGRR